MKDLLPTFRFNSNTSSTIEKRIRYSYTHYKLINKNNTQEDFKYCQHELIDFIPIDLNEERFLREFNLSSYNRHLNNISLYKENVKKINEIASYEEIISFMKEIEISFDEDTFTSLKKHSEKWKFSLISLISVIDYIKDISSHIRLYYDNMIGIFCIDIYRKTELGYYTSMNLQFLKDGSINFIVSDSDEGSSSHIRGTITKYRKYKNTYRFKSILNILYYGG